MIDREQITLKWIEKVSKENRKADKILVEKAIRALLLLEGLVKKKLNFVFKGGTALMLHFESIKRLSIDVDIIIANKPENLDAILENVMQEQGFLRKEKQQRKINNKIKKAHYKYFYEPLHKTGKEEEYVLLDILFEEVYYEKIVKLNIESSFVPTTGEPFKVSTPSIDDITGDKLTAFAPNTTGIPYYKGKDSRSMEIIKQLYDIGNLVDNVKDIEITKTTFKKFAQTELSYRELNNLTEQDVLDDIYQTAICIVSRGNDGKGIYDELAFGITRIRSFIFSESYYLEKAIIHASKAAYIATLLKQEEGKIEKYENPLQMRDWFLTQPFNNKLNKLKKSNPEAFFYLFKINELTVNKN
jgi:predicted nucleotidyltransferase component of viral defense system